MGVKGEAGLSATKGLVLLNDQQELYMGNLVRYKISVDLGKLEQRLTTLERFTLRVKNVESSLLRPVYLTGPYALYVDIRPHNFDEGRRFEGEDLQFTSDLKPDEVFQGELKIGRGSRVGLTDVFSWTVDVLSQLTVTADHAVGFRLCVADSEEAVRAAMKRPREECAAVQGLRVEILDTFTLWNAPPRYPRRPAHLVIVTHGVFSNVGCDMLYLMDRLLKVTEGVGERDNANVVVRGYRGNSGKSHKGIEYLGNMLANYVVKLVPELRAKYKVNKISFIGHSLGGVVQAAAIHRIAADYPTFFDAEQGGLRPVNFVAVATPFLGVIGDFPVYAAMALYAGALGKTGRDLNLKKEVTKAHPKKARAYKKKDRKRIPVLEWIPTGAAKHVLQRFTRRTVYANALHDGIVPLRTSALLYLDWYSLQQVNSMGDQLAYSEGDVSSKEGKSSDAVEIPAENVDKRRSLQWLLPRGLVRHKYKWYKRSQTITPGEETIKEDNDFHPPTKASALMSAANLLKAPLPTQQYLKNPAVRTDSILHDKVYHPEELPPTYYHERELYKKILYPNDRIHRVEERTARNWQETMSWRKVLMNIQPESHNNIIVRRRFVNAFGWVAIEHLVQEHFGEGVM